jgi:peptidyl-prolyl cis-trans isomerase SurA
VRPLRLLLGAGGAALLALAALPARATGDTEPAQAAGDQRLVVDRVVAVVNDSVILYSELMRRVAPLAAELDNVSDPRERERRRDKLKTDLLQEMIDEELVLQAATESKLEVSAKEVQSALEEIKRQNDLDDNQLAEALRLQGYTMAGYRADLRKQIMRMRAVRWLVRPRVTVTDDDVRARYDAMLRRSAAVRQVHLHHILIEMPDRPSSQQLSAAKARATEIIERARAGTEFGELAREHSDDESTKATGGDLGWIERGSLPSEWEVIVFAMGEGEIRGPITSPRGLHVFRVSAVQRVEQKPFDEVKEQVREELLMEETDRQTRLWLEDLRKRAHVDTKL